MGRKSLPFERNLDAVKRRTRKLSVRRPLNDLVVAGGSLADAVGPGRRNLF
jgi:hypothetical protein